MTKKPIGFASVAIILACMTASLTAAPFAKKIKFSQPNGTVIELWGQGDEFHAVFETPDGYTVVFDPNTKSYQYAKLSADSSELLSTGRQVGQSNPLVLGITKHLRINADSVKRKAQARFRQWDKGMEIGRRWNERKAIRRQVAQAAAGGPALAPPSSTTTGNKLGLCLLVDFDDDPATVPQANIVDFCNGDSYTGYGNNGSVKKYFYDNANGLLTYSNVVTVYIRIPNTLHPKSYYNNITRDAGANANLLIRDAITIMKALPNYTTEILPTFNNLTVDASSNVVACNVFYAGGNGGVWAMGLWPHSWALYNVGAQLLSAGGKKVYFYQITDIGSSLELGTFCHENGHMLCDFPDIYDYTYLSVGGAGSFCLMGYGGSGGNPVQVDAYLKRAAGWATTTDLTSSSNLTASLTASAGPEFNHFYRFQKPGVTTEYFLVENRQKAGRDALIAASGIAIWHVDELGDRDNRSLITNSIHANFELTLVQADNLWHFQNNINYGDSRDLYYSGNPATGYTNRFTDNTSPNAHWWNGSLSGVNFRHFSSSGDTMTFVIGEGGMVILPSTLTYTATIGGANPTSLTFVVTNEGLTAFNFTNTVSYSAGASNWFTPSSPTGHVSAAGSLTVTGSVNIAGLLENTYYATNTFTAPEATNSPQTLVVTLRVNPLPVPGEVAFSAASYTANENAGSAALTVTRSSGCDGAASVNYSTQNGTAIAGVDYTAASGTLSWSDGESAGKTITVTIITRPGKQDSRAFDVNLSGASGVSLASPYSATVTIMDSSPSSPTGVIAGDGTYSNKVLVYWTAASGATSYKVWRGVDANSQNASLLGTCTAPFYLDTSTTPDILYYYWIQAACVTETSDLSVPDSGYCGTVANLPGPAGVQASDGSYTDRIRITWQAVSKATHYEVWRNTENNRSAASLISEPTGTSYDDYPFSQGICYYYWLKAKTAYRDGNFSESDAGWRRLSAPSGVIAGNGSYPYHIRVVWNAVANATWYEVWRKEIPGYNSPGGNPAKVAQTGELYFNDYYTKAGVYYCYMVKSCNELCSSLDYGQSTGHRQVNASPTSLSAINDYDGDQLSDLALFSPLSGSFDLLCSALGRHTFSIGAERSQGVAGDYDGDRATDPVAYCPDSGMWLFMISSMGYYPIIRGSFGGNGDHPVAADFDGDGLADIGVYNETDGVLSIILSNGGARDIRVSCLVGGPGYSFVSADFDGDGPADPTVYSESEGCLKIFFSGSEYVSVSVALGGPGMSMYTADFDGDGLADPVLYEPATGTWTIFLSSAQYGAAKISFGGSGYAPIIGDYDGDGLADPAIYRETDGQWFIMFSTSCYSVIAETFGSPDYQPITR